MALNYARMPGMGDLPGDSYHPNSPDYVEPEFDRTDAAGWVASSLIKDEMVGELVEEVADARALLDWIAHNVELPTWALNSFRALDRQAKTLSTGIDRELAELSEDEA